jgi:hypothetical protein
MAGKRATLIALLVIGASASLTAADHNVSIASVTVGAKPWQWTVFIKGTPDALAHVGCVQYVLDPSFPNPHRTVCDRDVQGHPFGSSGVTWGPFNLSVTVTFDDKTVQQLQYTLDPQAASAAPDCSTIKVTEHIVTALGVGGKTIYTYILKQRLWHADNFADVYFFAKKPWTDDAIEARQFTQRIQALAPGDYIKLMNPHNGESKSFHLGNIDASVNLEMHPIHSFANVTICLKATQ